MALEGTIQDVGIFELLQLLAMSQKTGTLTIVSVEDVPSVVLYFRKGNYIYADVQERLKQMLPRLRGIDENELESLVGESDKRLEEILVEKGIFTAGELERLVKRLMEETIYAIFKLKEGRFRFVEEEFTPPLGFNIAYKIENIIMEGARRIDELSRISDSIPHQNIVFMLSGDALSKPEIHLNPKEWQVLSFVDGQRKVGDIVALMGEEFETMKILYGLMMAGFIKVKDTGEERPDIDTKEGLEKLVGMDPDNTELRYRLAGILEKEGDYRGAIDQYSVIRSITPMDHKVAYYLGFCYAKLGDLRRAIGEWGNYLSHCSNDEVGEYVRDLMDKALSLDSLLTRKSEYEEKV